jgi:hypothetical protein
VTLRPDLDRWAREEMWASVWQPLALPLRVLACPRCGDPGRALALLDLLDRCRARLGLGAAAGEAEPCAPVEGEPG